MNDSDSIINIIQEADTTRIYLGPFKEIFKPEDTSFSLLEVLPSLIGVVIGALVTFLAQWMLREFEFKKERLKITTNALAEIFSELTKLKFQIKKLAYLEVDSKYQIYNYYTLIDQNEKKLSLEEHIKDYAYKSEVVDQISTSCGLIFGAVKNLQGKKKKIALEQSVDRITSLIHEIVHFEGIPEFKLPGLPYYPIPHSFDLSAYDPDDSASRKRLISKLNDQYNTTLKKLNDEILVLKECID